MNAIRRLETALLTILSLCLCVCTSLAQERDVAKTQEKVSVAVLGETSVGMRFRIDEMPLSGSKLRVKPVPDAQKADVILRILNVFPHGNSFRYNLEVMPLVSGRLDLRKYLIREDGSSTADLPELPIVVKSVLPFDRVLPNELNIEEPEEVGGYRNWLIILACVWTAGLLAILLVRRKSTGLDQQAQVTGPLTLADRMRPLVEQAQAGTLDDHGCAELERLILAYWRRAKGLGDVDAGLAISSLRRDPEAGKLLLQLEHWLHAPAPDNEREPADLATLLEPYRNIPDSIGEAAC